MLYLFDTNALSDYMAGHAQLRARVAGLTAADEAVICTIVRGEILFGIERLPSGSRRTQLEGAANGAFQGFRCLAIPETAADVYATLNLACQRTGNAMDENDLWIAATAVAGGAILVTRDKDCSRFPGLVVQDWTV
jgi:predicted nucleic acid-binding protein